MWSYAEDDDETGGEGEWMVDVVIAETIQQGRDWLAAHPDVKALILTPRNPRAIEGARVGDVVVDLVDRSRLGGWGVHYDKLRAAVERCQLKAPR